MTAPEPVRTISTNLTARATERWTLVLASVASLMVALDVLVVSTALGTIREHLGASIDQLEWTVNAYSLSFAVLLITASVLGDRYGRRRMFAGEIGLFVFASALCALAPNIGLLIAARALQGAAAVLGGPVLGGAVTQGLAWQFVFWINVPIGLVAIPFGCLLAVAFVLAELRSAAPMLPMRLFASRSFSAGSAANFLLAGSLFGGVFFMAQFQQFALHQGPLAAGLRLLPWTGAVFVIAPIAGAQIARVGERPLVAGGLALQAAGMLWIALVARAGVPYRELVAPMVLSGIGLSAAIPAAQNAVVSAVAPADVGRASGVFTMMRQLGAVFGIAIVVAVFAGSGGYASAHAFSDGFIPAIAVTAGFGFAAALAGLLLPVRTARAGEVARFAAEPPPSTAEPAQAA